MQDVAPVFRAARPVPRFSYFGIRISSSLNATSFNGIVSYRCTLTLGPRLMSHNPHGGRFLRNNPSWRKISRILSFLFTNFWLSGITCIWYKNRTHVPSRMNTPDLGPIIEVISQPSDIGDQNETKVSRETTTAIHPFGSALLRLELVLSLICVRRTRACPAQARTRVRRTG